MTVEDFTRSCGFQRLLVEAAQFRLLRSVYESDPQIKPGTSALLRECFAAARRDDPGLMRSIAEGDGD
jgi:hypothetical protein